MLLLAKKEKKEKALSQGETRWSQIILAMDQVAFCSLP